MNAQYSETSTEPEEIDENTDPFIGVDIGSDMECSDDSDSHSDMVDNSDESHSDISHNDTTVCDILLDSTINSEDEDIDDGGTDSECEDTDSEHEDVDSKREDTGFEDEGVGTQGKEELEGRLGEGKYEESVDPGYGFNVDLDVVPPQPTHGVVGRRPPPYTAGCVWTKEDWSCSYDAVFMAFWSLYEQSPTSWLAQQLGRARARLEHTAQEQLRSSSHPRRHSSRRPGPREVVLPLS